MTNKNENTNQQNDNVYNPDEPDIPVESAPIPEDNISFSAEEAGELLKEFEKYKDEYDALNDKYLRIAAEYDNYRKRTAKEKESIYTAAAADVLKTILPVYDNIERAAAYSDPEKVLDGLKMILKQFDDSLNTLGITEIPALGEAFNPELHNAVFHEEDESEDVNLVVDVLQKGYAKGDRIIRPAMVKVKN